MLIEITAAVLVVICLVAAAYLIWKQIDAVPPMPKREPEPPTPVVRLYPPRMPVAPSRPSAADCERAIVQIEETRDRLLIKRKANRDLRDYTEEDRRIVECNEHIDGLRRYLARVSHEEAMS